MALKKTRIIKIFAAIFCASIIALAFIFVCSCNKENSGDKDTFVGTWHMVGMVSNGETFSDEDMKLMQELCLTSTLTLTSTSNATLEHMGKTYTGEWSQFNDTNIKLSIGGKSEDCSLQDGVLSVDVNSDVVKYRK
ncbi:MAG: hypothetical protein HUJ51_01715 [Eggerthellaceae bacterium]|nr:hypothetical protein [Eggerthellaceae bacterium]